MAVNIHIKRGREFRNDLYQSKHREAWLEAVGKELENKGVALKLGQGAGAVTVHNNLELLNFYKEYKSDPDAMAVKVGLPKGRELSEYMADLMQALDDVVKDTTHIDPGSVIDLSSDGQLAKTLGMVDAHLRYASSRTELGKALAKPEGTMSVLGVQMSKSEIKPSDPLEGMTFMDASTFASGSLSKGRSSQEFETVRRLGGLDAADIVKLARTDRGGKTAFQRMRKARDSEAFAIGYDYSNNFDKVPWNKNAHATREALPFTSLTVEDGRLAVDEKNGRREVSQGTDYFADTYYKAKDLKDPKADALLENGIMVRARIRYDNPGSPRRILVQSKVGSGVDENGMKAAAKADIRDDSPSAKEIADMDNMVRSGKSDWGGSYYGSRPIEAMSNVYHGLKEKGALQDAGEHKDVLLLEAGANVFSIRSRYHLNETNSAAINKLFSAGQGWIDEVKNLIDASENPSDFAEISQQAEALKDHSAILERAREGLAELDGKKPDEITMADVNKYWPRASSWGSSKSPTDADHRKVVAEALSAAYHDFAASFDDQRKDIAAAKGGDVKKWRLADAFFEFAKVENKSLFSTTTVKPFIEYFDKQLAGPDKDAFVSKFATWLKEEKAEPALSEATDKDAALAMLRKNLVNEHLDILHRQVEAAGTAATQLWFNEARDAYAHINPQTNNFLIDTFDFVSDIKPEDWQALSEDQRNGKAEIPADKIYNADIISEVQIELGYEKPYTEAIRKAKAALQGARASIFVDYALANAADSQVEANKPESFVAFQNEILALPDAERNELLNKINTFAQDKGSILKLTSEDLQALDAKQITGARRGQSYDSHAGLQKTLETDQFIWNQLIHAQEYIADLRGRRVKKEAKRAGFDGLTWEHSDMSKGTKALRLLQD